ncbi:FAD-dependent oxidoreductase [Pelagicoccus enzymogenes]|uniref:FAD-dependent oxidoreductase n=1 Tax=Pelagicoccus enzymogenes TaxID=2773457 RepID=UPI00281221AA|nr:FAD-dependent oxidoreductase [Pelagicoccus enzymogenes]
MKPSHPESPPLRIVIVGNGMVSHRFCDELSKAKFDQKLKVDIFGEEPHPAYDRVHLTDYFKKPSPKTLSLGNSDWYSQKGYKLHCGLRIEKVDREQRTVIDATGQSHPYDKLVLATGSYPFVPPIEGSDAPGVFVYRTIADADAIIRHCEGKSSAIVLGGGLLGLEAANALKELGLSATVVEFANGLMPRQLNQDASLVLEQQIRQLGVTPLVGKGAQKIERSNDGLLVSFNDDTKLLTDILVVAAGVRPADQLARDADLNLGARGGIIVNDQLQTSDPSIYAIGECALHRGQIYGFVAPGYQMAEVLADQLCDGSKTYQGSDLSCRLKLLGIEVSTFGDYLGEGRTLVHRSPTSYRMIVLKRDCFAGGTVVGKWDQTHQLQLAIKEERFMTPSEQAAFEKDGQIPEGDALADWPNNAIICNCTQTTKGSLSICISSGCKTVSSLGKATGAGSVCGSCRPLLAQLCGESGQEAAYRPKGRKSLSTTATVALLACLGFLLLAAFPEPQSVQTLYFKISKLWHESLYKQVSGYSMAGLSLLALLLSARKRVRFLRQGNYGWWRAAHAILGTLCLAALVAHTGLDFGKNLNLWLMSCFVGLNLVGALAGLSIAMEDRFSGPWSRRIRSLVTKAHILFFWPYPVLLGFHIYKAYAY